MSLSERARTGLREMPSNAGWLLSRALKPAESGSGAIVRLYESLGRPTTTALRTSLPHARATETDLLERPTTSADLSHLEFGPFEIKTLLLETR